MPYQHNLQPDFDNEPDSKKLPSNSLSHEIEELQNGIKVDFDQKLSELSDLLQRFKALVLSTDKKASPEAANEPNAYSSNPDCAPTPQTVFQTQVQHAEGAKKNSNVEIPFEKTPGAEDKEDTLEACKPVPTLYTAETARFENGLYKLNSQLYRFRLELDQEMEFREEPLHAHFSQQSELSQILQQMNERSIEKFPGQ